MFASTLMVKQHVVLDVVAAIVVVELGLFLSRRFNLSKIYFIIEDRLFKNQLGNCKQAFAGLLLIEKVFRKIQ